MLAVWAVFLLSGLWHGAAWHFVVWGGIHAAYLSVGTATALWRSRAAQAIGLSRVPRAHAVLKVLVTFGLVSLAWVFFRATDVASAVLILSRLGTGWSFWTAESLVQMGISPEAFRLLAAVIAVVEVASWLDSRHRAPYPLAGRWAPMRALGYAGIVIGILEFGVVETVPFIYLQF
jgi:D-alanyl-lipoteichoic acid acyltransferase DltB (MBOAT superfamily)